MESEMVKIYTGETIVKNLKATRILIDLPDMITDLGKLGDATEQRLIDSYSLAAQVLIIAARHNYPFSPLLNSNIGNERISRQFDVIVWEIVTGDTAHVMTVINNIHEINEASYKLVTSRLWRILDSK